MEKKSKQYNFKKIILTIFNIILTTIFILCFIGTMIILYKVGGDWNSLSENTKYEDSQVLQQKLQRQSGYVWDYYTEAKYFETDGEFDETKEIDVFDYSAAKEYSKNYGKNPLYYTIEDLQEANQEISVQEYQWGYYADYWNDAEQENIYGLYDLKDGTMVEIEQLLTPQNFKTLEEYIEKYDISRERCIRAIGATLENIDYDISDYEANLDAYDVKTTNLRFTLLDKDGKSVFANTKTGQITSDLSDAFQIENGNITIELAVDTKFPIQDSFYDEKQEYEAFVPYYKLYFGGMIAGFIGAIVTLVWLTVLSGRTTDSNQIVLSWIDKPKTEIAAAIWIAFGVLGGTGIVFLIDVFWNGFQKIAIIFLSIICLIFSVICLCAYLSLVRRIKAKTIASNSLCHEIKKSFGTIMRNANISLKVFGCFLIYLILSAAFLMGGGFLSALLYILLNIAVGYFIWNDITVRQTLVDCVKAISQGDIQHQVDIEKMTPLNKKLAEGINSIRDGLQKAVAESVKSERLKTDLITNVSHDIKTPLTSIINYVTLLQQEEIKDEKVKGYIDVIEQKSQRLKQLTEDLVEASKISSGNITLEMIKINFNELLEQTLGEFEEKFEQKKLHVILNRPQDSVSIMADGRRVWRVVENLFQNIYKYAMPNTRVYIDLTTDENKMMLTLKNISENPLNIQADELTERFIRGDVSRSTEGSGLGLSIAKNLTDIQNGEFDIYLDGDLFKVTLTFLLTD